MTAVNQISDKKSALPDEFVWYRSLKKDYSIVEGKRVLKGDVVLFGELKVESFIVNSEGGKWLKQEEYYPLVENRFLHRDFALMEYKVSSVKNFSEQYGLLGVDEIFHNTATGENVKSSGERLSVWFEEASDLRKAIDLWDKAQNEDLQGLEERLKWHEQDNKLVLMDIYQRPEGISPDSKIVVDSQNDAVIAKQLKEIPIFEQAQFVVSQEINNHLYKYTSAMIHQDVTQSKTPVIKMASKNLLGWLWVQLANEVTRESVYFVCLNCGKRMLKKVTRGQPSKTCSASCRVQISQRKTQSKKG